MSQTGYPPAPMPQPPAQQTSTLAVLGLVFAFVAWPVGLVLSILGLRDVSQNRKSGRGLALAGLIVSGVAALLTLLGIVLFVLFAGAAASVAGETAESVEVEQDAGMADVVLNSCTVGEFGIITADLTITNSSDAEMTYTVTVSANDAAGTRLAELTAISNSIAPGQSAQVQATGVLEGAPADLQCVVANVSRF